MSAFVLAHGLRGVAIAASTASSFSDDGGSGGLEGRLEGLARSSLDGVDLGETERDLGEGARVLSEDLVGGNDAGLDDLDGLVRSSVSSTHLHVYTISTH